MSEFVASYGLITEKATPDEQHWQLSDPETLKAVADMQKKGVKRLKWKGHPGCCDNCLKNAGKVVKLGEPFPSGAICTPEHNRCICDMEELMS